MRRCRLVHCSVLIMAFATAGLAQTDWRPLFDVNTPRAGHALAFDTARGVTVAFGGATTNAFGGFIVGATAVWDGRLWRAANPANEPPPRQNHVMAYDIARARVVLFGGAEVTRALDDTWEWDGTTWTQRTPETSPPARSSPAMAYDVGRLRMVLFGGTTDTFALLADTWEWDGINWTQRVAAVSPPARQGHAAAYDLLRGHTVVFGGPVNDVWEWNGNVW